MRLPPALAPLRHRAFRSLWFASVITWLGIWLQSTSAGWLMTSLSTSPLTVSMVQAATILPLFLLALPAGALADIIDRRLFLIGTQVWTMAAAGLLAALTLSGAAGIWGLLALTFAIGVGFAMTSPAWGAIVPELVPREDLVQAIALNGIGFNLARAIGPALAGVVVVLAGPGVAFAAFAVSILAVITALALWRRDGERSVLPREHLLSAMRAGTRFVRNTPAMRAAMLRAFAYSLPAAAPWAVLPLVVREQLGFGAGMYGLILGVMGAGGVAAGMGLPALRKHADLDAIVLIASVCSCAGVALLGLSRHWLPASLAMLLFGLGWVTALSTLQAAAQLVAPPWVRARALAIYQLSFNGALALGAFGWGWLGTRIGLPGALVTASAGGLVLAFLVRGYRVTPAPGRASGLAGLRPQIAEAPAAEIAAALRTGRGRVLECVRYRVAPTDRDGFVAAMMEVRRARGRAGALFWQLYEDVAHPDGWLETWSMESWTDHLRESSRLSAEDQAALAHAASFQQGDEEPALSRYLAVTPQDPNRAARNGAAAADGAADRDGRAVGRLP